MLICTVTMHLVADAVAGAVDVPLIHVIDETAFALKRAGCRRPLLLATRYTMEQGFYQAHMARHDVEVMVPDAQARKEVHAIIFDELCQGW
jgi:aspartate racemase